MKFSCELGCCGQQCLGSPLRLSWDWGSAGWPLGGVPRLHLSQPPNVSLRFTLPHPIAVTSVTTVFLIGTRCQALGFKPSLTVSEKLPVCCFPSPCTSGRYGQARASRNSRRSPKPPPPPTPLPSFSKLQQDQVCGFSISGELFERKGPFSRESQK